MSNLPFTRGKERSSAIDSILDEVKLLRDQGVKEITLLGQNVNSYRDLSKGLGDKMATHLIQGFKTVYKAKVGGLRFAELLEEVADLRKNLQPNETNLKAIIADVTCSEKPMLRNNYEINTFPS